MLTGIEIREAADNFVALTGWKLSKLQLETFAFYVLQINDAVVAKSVDMSSLNGFQRIPRSITEPMHLILAPLTLHPEVVYKEIVREGERWEAIREFHNQQRVR